MDMRKSMILLLVVGCSGTTREPERPVAPGDEPEPPVAPHDQAQVIDVLLARFDDAPIDDGRPRERVTLDDAIARDLVAMQATGAGVHHLALEVKARAD